MGERRLGAADRPPLRPKGHDRGGPDQQKAAEQAAARRRRASTRTRICSWSTASFEHLPLGRVAPRHDPRTLRSSRSYIDDAVLLPEIPETFDLVPQVASWPMYGNDSLGDCTIAAVGHMVQAWYAAARRPRHPRRGRCHRGLLGDRVERHRPLRGRGPELLAATSGDRRSQDRGVRVRRPVRTSTTSAPRSTCSAASTPASRSRRRAVAAVWDVVGRRQDRRQPARLLGRPRRPLPAALGRRTDSARHLGARPRGDRRVPPRLLRRAVRRRFRDFLTDGKTPAGFDLDALQADLAEIGQAAPGLHDRDRGPRHDDVRATRRRRTSAITDPAASAPAAPADETAPPEPLPPHFDENYYWQG
jgi:hypothetical protein